MKIKAQALVDGFKKALAEKAGYIWGTSGTIWTEAKQTNVVNMIERDYGPNWISSDAAKKDNYYSAARYGEKWIGHVVYDCSGLFKAVFEANGGIIAHGSNSIWDRYCTDKGALKNGKRTDGKELLPGTAVFTETEENKKILHNHIGLYIGGGKVIEAKGTQAGVVESKITDAKWKDWGELKGVTYGQEAQDTGGTGSVDRPTLRKGNKGDTVRDLQTKLINQGYSCGSYGADGDFGSATEKAVKAFQKDHNLTQDGIVGPKTWAAMELANARPPTPEKTYTVTIRGLSKAEATDIAKKYKNTTTVED